jgi:hypothetical protein
VLRDWLVCVFRLPLTVRQASFLWSEWTPRLSTRVLLFVLPPSKHKSPHLPSSTTAFIHIATMLSFTDLPPEIRWAIYETPLQSTLAKTTRILYSGKDPLRCGDTPHCIRHNQPFKRNGRDGKIEFLDARIIYARDIRRAKYKIHHADLDDLVPLASTCRLVRSDLLAFAWSRAEIHITSPELHTELHCIFFDRLTSESCNFIRTLEIDVHDRDWLPSEMRKIIGLIRRRIPQLEKLSVNIHLTLTHDRVPFASGLAAFRILPPSVALDFNHSIDFYLRAVDYSPIDGPRTVRSSVQHKPEVMALNSLRAELSLIGQKRREEQAKRGLGDQVGGILEATVDIRSLQLD